MKKFLASAWALIKEPFNAAIDKAQATFPPNRIVAILTPTVFMPVSAWLTGWGVKHLPGLPVPSATEIDGLMIAGSLGALAAAYKWIDGWQKHEERTAARARISYRAAKQQPVVRTKKLT